MANYATLVALGENCIQTIKPGEAIDFSKANACKDIVNGIVDNGGITLKINRSGLYHINGFVITDSQIKFHQHYKIHIIKNDSENVAIGQGNLFGNAQISFCGIAHLNQGDELKLVNKSDTYAINIDGVRLTIYKIH